MKAEDFENFDGKNLCRHGNPRIILPEGVSVREGGIVDEKTGGLVEVNKKPLWINPCRTLTSARHGFMPITLKASIDRLGEEEGKKYYEQWWCVGEFSGGKA
jgi:hypothetical protein